jgi:Flp pilus assembly protein TadG
MRNLFRRLFRAEHGQALVEFALGSTIFLTTVFVTLEFALAVWQYNTISDLAQQGARWASVRGSTATSPPGAATPATVQTFVQGRAVGTTVTVTTTPSPATLKPGQTVSVSVQTTFSPLTSLIPLSTTMHSTASMIMAR